jgi:hypothetical protein
MLLPSNPFLLYYPNKIPALLKTAQQSSKVYHKNYGK